MLPVIDEKPVNAIFLDVGLPFQAADPLSSGSTGGKPDVERAGLTYTG
jgi:hypothetical protein